MQYLLADGEGLLWRGRNRVIKEESGCEGPDDVVAVKLLIEFLREPTGVAGPLTDALDERREVLQGGGGDDERGRDDLS